jgi:hypothetical protein
MRSVSDVGPGLATRHRVNAHEVSELQGRRSSALMVVRMAALAVTPVLALAAADAGGWVRFSVGCVIATVGVVVLRQELRNEHDR